MRILAVLFLGMVLAAPLDATADAAKTATVYKDPLCGCCNGYIAHLRNNGFAVEAVNLDDMSPLKRMAGVPEPLESCHTMVIDGYVVEGHVPLAAIDRMLREKPAIKGIALPGMPAGSPGMGGRKERRFAIYGFSGKGHRVYTVE